MKCKEMIACGKCHGDCCGIVALYKDVAKRNEHKAQRKVTEVLEYSETEVLPVTEDMKCVFLQEDYSCAIYVERPEVCRRYGFEPQLPCPYLKPNDNPRTPAKTRRTLRFIKRDVKEKLRRIEKMELVKDDKIF